MATYISILRGINVAGHNQIKMDDLLKMYTSLGFSDVRTYIQSGNVIFHSETSSTQTLEKSISENIFKTFGFSVQVLVLTVEALKTVLHNNPFSIDSTKESAFLHLTFLSGLPDKTLFEMIPTGIYLPDEFCISGKTIYLYCPTGYGNTKLNNNFFENRLKLRATTRNLKTASELLVLAERV